MVVSVLHFVVMLPLKCTKPLMCLISPFLVKVKVKVKDKNNGKTKW